ncbi:nicotinate phosphoribosyltransferase [Frankia sp. Cppng1_Ct_nod]|uniref:nicotinate phosphoribosyltransferase n=1 Tax=Frankia sp. Cppng1_Ct_nod TaxID=2897162 RepID=UPI0010417C3D|nr:nicotinate phosphoribosyltransferase [Frankia sp. Cppng1_Ct_nod]
MATSTSPSIRPPAPASTASTALLTDHYELTMLQAALRSGTASCQVVFEVFARTLPAGRRFGVVAGIGRLLDALAAFRFETAELAFLREAGIIDDATTDYLAGYRFSGDIHGFAEGEPFMPNTPVLVVEGTFAECVLLETLVLSVLNHDSAIAGAGARMVAAAAGRPCIDMGSRRAHEQAAVAAARTAYLVGFTSTSSLEAGRRWGIPTTGTAAHAFTLLYPSERAAFAAQVATLGVDTTLLVDTYDVPAAIATAVEVAGPRLGAVRLDSGDLAVTARAVRAQLDSLGATDTRIIATGDLDEHLISRLAQVPIDGYGVGTKLVTGSGAPTAGFVYKLVEVDSRPVAKASVGKSTKGGRKQVTRHHDRNGVAVADVVTIHTSGSATGVSPVHVDAPGTPSTDVISADHAADHAAGTGLHPAGRGESCLDRPLLVPLVRGGRVLNANPAGAESLLAARSHHEAALASLPTHARSVAYGGPCLPVITAGQPSGQSSAPSTALVRGTGAQTGTS